MPCKQNSQYDEWQIWFERHVEFMREDVILVGHSLSGGFLSKWLSENILPVSIKQLHLVAATFSHESDDYKLSNFRNKSFPGKFFENNIKDVYIYHSEDDPEVPLLESERYHSMIPNSHFHKLNDRGHFLGEEFPELFENIKKSL